MQTLRGRLTAWYSGALALTLAVFGGVLYLDRRSASYQDLDQRIQSEAALTAGILAESYRARGTLVRADSAQHPVLIPDLAALLEAVPDFLVITARDGSLLFASSDARALTFQQVEQLRSLASAPLSGRSSGTLRLEPNGPKVHYAVHYVTGAGPQFGAIRAGADVRTAELGPDELLSTFALVLPLGVALALLMGSWISRRALAAVDQMMTRLERSFAALRRFTADASHELKTPLSVLRAGVERAITTPNLPQDTLATLEETLQEIKRMTELVDALLTLARADEGIAPLHREPVNLRAIVEEVRETGELLAEESGVRVDVATPH